MAEAVGILEVFGLTTAFVAADAGCKAANVRLEVFDKNKPANADSLPVPLLVCIKFRGSVEDVTEAVDAGIRVAGDFSAAHGGKKERKNGRRRSFTMEAPPVAAKKEEIWHRKHWEWWKQEDSPLQLRRRMR